MVTKLIILSLIIISVLFIFRLFNKISSSNEKNNKTTDEIVDLEKDPTSDEYIPKDSNSDDDKPKD